jgi:hypothetical protein
MIDLLFEIAFEQTAVVLFVLFGIFNYLFGRRLAKSEHEDTARRGRHIILRFWYGVGYILTVCVVFIGWVIVLDWMNGWDALMNVW